jgi:putative ATP-dependent endonuclease of the OLD family
LRIDTIRVQNFRCFEDETVSFNDYTCLVGANGSGKSTVLAALRVFFGDSPGATGDFVRLQKDDLHNRDTSREAAITLTFCDLEPESEEEFKHYARQGRLVVSAVAAWDEAANTAEVKRFGERLLMKAFAPFFEAEAQGKKVQDLQKIYAEICEQNAGLGLPPVKTKDAMKSALREFESSHPELCELGRSSDLFYGFTRGSDRLKKFVEWVFVPAVKDASTEQLEARKTALGLLLERTVRSKMSFEERINALRGEVEGKYEEILSENQEALKSLSDSLTARLQEWAHPDALLSLLWRNDPSKNITIQAPQAEVRAGERGFQGAALDHFGHGLQRSFIFALLQELSGCGDAGIPRLLLACEEPELYQHPPQARHLSSVLQKLSNSNAQVIVSTHSPLFVSGQGFPGVRLFRRGPLDNQPRVQRLTFEDLSRTLREARGPDTPSPDALKLKVEQIVQPALREMFFASVLVLVEGPEDLGYIGTYLELSGWSDEFRRLGCHIVPTSGKGQMVYALAIAKHLDIPTFTVFDADGDERNPSNRTEHELDNVALLRLCGVDDPVPFPPDILWMPSLVVWPTKIGKAVRNDIGNDEWGKSENLIRGKHRLYDLAEGRKNALLLGLVLTALYQSGTRSRVLDLVCSRIISFARGEHEARPVAAARAVPNDSPVEPTRD